MTASPRAPDGDAGPGPNADEPTPEQQVVLLWRRVTERIPPGEEGFDWLAAVTGVNRDDIDLARSTRDAVIHRTHTAMVQVALPILRRLNRALDDVTPSSAEAALRRHRRRRPTGPLRRATFAVAGTIAVVLYLVLGLIAIPIGIMLYYLPHAVLISGVFLTLDALVNLVFALFGVNFPGYENPVIIFDGAGVSPTVYALQRGAVGVATMLVGWLLLSLRGPLGRVRAAAGKLLNRARRQRLDG